MNPVVKEDNFANAMNALKHFVKMESFAGLLLVCSAVIALIMANSPLQTYYDLFIDTEFFIGISDFALKKPLLLWINDGLMAIFFLLIGLELKREFLEGELSHIRQVVLPGIAAIGGIVVPAAIFYGFNRNSEHALQGWAIPTATDIAFALGVLALLRSRVPHALKIFLMTVAIFDDVAAIVIIAVFYSGQLSTISLVLAAIAVTLLFMINRLGVKALSPYILIGLFLWVCVLKSGVHATLAGVVIAFMIPLKGDSPTQSPLKEMEHRLHQWVTFLILPLFAFANAGVALSGVGLEVLVSPVSAGIALGLLMGKQVGVFGFSWLCIKLKLAQRPEGVSWAQLYGVAALCGIGFTMSLFISSLAYEGETLSITSRVGILTGSLVSAVMGLLILYRCSPSKKSV